MLVGASRPGIVLCSKIVGGSLYLVILAVWWCTVPLLKKVLESCFVRFELSSLNFEAALKKSSLKQTVLVKRPAGAVVNTSIKCCDIRF